MGIPNSIDYQTRNNTVAILERVDDLSIKLIQLEAMISGLTEAMRPLLEEWKEVKTKLSGLQEIVDSTKEEI